MICGFLLNKLFSPISRVDIPKIISNIPINFRIIIFDEKHKTPISIKGIEIRDILIIFVLEK